MINIKNDFLKNYIELKPISDHWQSFFNMHDYKDHFVDPDLLNEITLIWFGDHKI